MTPPPPPEAVATADALSADLLPRREAHRSVGIPAASFWRKLFAFSGPGYLVAVGYMDPGNWATGIAGGSAFGYRLLSVVVLANLMAMFLQRLAARLGIVTGLDLAQACRQRYGAMTRMLLWLLCELAIVACDLAELIGAAIALRLLFGLDLALGVALTGLEVLLVLALQARGFRKLEALVVSLMAVIGLCFIVELALARPPLAAVLDGLVPRAEIVTDPAMLYLAIGILGATVMPHNLYLHSSIVQTRDFRRTDAGKREAMRFATIDIVVALTLAIFVNASILVLAASTFHAAMTEVVGIDEAYRLLTPALRVGAAGTLFAVALLAAGHNASVTGTIAGQIVMEGFTRFRWPAWARRLVARLLAMVPALFVVTAYGEAGATQLLILSQVVLSLQLPFAVYPLVRLTGSRASMGKFANGPFTAAIAWTMTAGLIGLNGVLLRGMMD
ncbi:manganese transport protein [Rhodospirillales bacterium URHD0017]|nr:manganese transport protein [Rhodospirillales bacterium URHD0017]